MTQMRQDSVYLPCHMFCREGDGVFCNDRLSSRCVSSDEDRVAHFQMVHSFFLESIELKWVLGC